jgi:hypothetical protein
MSEYSTYTKETVYGPQRITIKNVLLILLFLTIGVWLFKSGLDHYSRLTDNEPLQQMRAVKSIIVGGLIFVFIIVAQFVRIVSMSKGLPRLTLSSEQIKVETLKRTVTARWASLGEFTVMPKTRVLRCKIIGKDISDNLQAKDQLIIPTTNADPIDLLRELSARRALAMGNAFDVEAFDATSQIIKNSTTALKRVSYMFICLIMSGLILFGVCIVSLVVAVKFYNVDVKPYLSIVVGGVFLAAIVIARILTTVKYGKLSRKA